MNIAIGTWPGPLFFTLATLLVAALSYAVHRWSLVSGLIAAAGCLALAWIAARQLSADQLVLFGRTLGIDRPLVILGRTWALTRSNLAALGLIYAMAGLTFLLALPTSQGWSFYSFGAGMLGILVMALTAQQYVYTILFIWLAANLAVFVLAGGRPGDTAAALRFLAFTSLAVMPLLILPQYLDPDPAGYVVALSPDAPPLASNALQIAAWLLVGGMAVLLMMGPFYGQLAAIGIHSTPMALPLMLTTFPMVVLHTLFRLWEAQPALLQERLFFQVSLWLGIATTGIGGVAAIGQRRWGALAGYATLVDWGAGLIAIGQGTLAGLELSVQMLVWRALSMLLVGTGWSALSRAAQLQDDLEHCRGLYLRRPLSVAALLIGLLSLAGYPLTPGAVGRWPLLIDLASGQPILSGAQAGFLARWIGQLPSQPEALWVLLLASVGVTVGAIASVHACLRSPQEDASKKSAALDEGIAPRRIGRAEAVDAVVSAGFALLALWLVGSFLLRPQPWLRLGQELLGGLSLPGS